MDLRLLRFSDRSALARAFARVVECSEVGSCVIEPDETRMRFVSPHKIAEDLIQAIYADGGLVWSTRHEVPGRGGSCGVMGEARH